MLSLHSILTECVDGHVDGCSCAQSGCEVEESWKMLTLMLESLLSRQRAEGVALPPTTKYSQLGIK